MDRPRSVGLWERRIEPKLPVTRSRPQSFSALPCLSRLLEFGVVFAPVPFLSLWRGVCVCDKMWSPAAEAFAVTLATAVLVSGSRTVVRGGGPFGRVADSG